MRTEDKEMLYVLMAELEVEASLRYYESSIQGCLEAINRGSEAAIKLSNAKILYLCKTGRPYESYFGN